MVEVSTKFPGGYPQTYPQCELRHILFISTIFGRVDLILSDPDDRITE